MTKLNFQHHSVSHPSEIILICWCLCSRSIS